MIYLPHGWCIHWNLGLLTLHVVSDIVVAACYFVIPAMILVLYRRGGRRLPAWVSWRLYVYFASFIFFCGMTHVMEAVVIWVPLYWVEGWIKFATAVSSVGTAVEMFRQMPRLVRTQVYLREAVDGMAKRLGVSLT